MRLCDICCGRHRNGDQSVLAADHAPSLVKLRYNDIRNSKVIQADRDGCNVNNRIYSPYLVEMHFFQGSSVRFRFRFRKNPENVRCDYSGALRHLRILNNPQNFRKSPVVMMVGMFRMTVLMVAEVFRMTVLMMPEMFWLAVTSVTMCMLFMVVFLMTVSVMSMYLLGMSVMPIQIFIIMVMVLMFLVQYNIKIAGSKP